MLEKYTTVISTDFRSLCKMKQRSLNKDVIRYSDTSATSKKNLSKGFKRSGFSSASQKKCRKSINAIGLFAIQQKIINRPNDFVTSAMSFITLTLPSSQVDDSRDISNVCLRYFFERFRKLGLLRNYVWKAEKQKNGNIHYHIATDSKINRGLVYRFWLSSVNALGYVDRFREKMRTLSFEEYCELPSNTGKDARTLGFRYAKGVRTDWRFPKCCDVRYCDSGDALENYISKYIAKEVDDADDVGRVWSRSESVKALCEKFSSLQVPLSVIWDFMRYRHNRKFRIFDYCEKLYNVFTGFKAFYSDLWSEVCTSISSYYQPCSNMSFCPHIYIR